MVKGHENLIPLNRRTKEEQRRIAKMGGEASVAVRRKKTKMKECALLFGDMPVDDKSAKAMTDLGVEDAAYHVRNMQAVISLYQKAMKGDVAAFNALRDIRGENPKEKIENTMQTQIVIGFVDTGLEPFNDEGEIK